MIRIVGGYLLLIAFAWGENRTPELEAHKVVHIVASALHANDRPIPNHGIFVAYQFASPANHEVTGPYGHFLRLVKLDEAAFASESPVYEGVLVAGDHASEIVHFGPVWFQFTLTREQFGEYVGRWMVDSVLRVK